MTPFEIPAVWSSRRILAAYVLLVSQLAACRMGVEPSAKPGLRGIVAAPHGLVVAINPANCSFTTELTDLLNLVDSGLGGHGTALVYGIVDSVEAVRALEVLGLKLRVRALSAPEIAGLSSQVDLPFVALIRANRLEWIVSGDGLDKLDRWLVAATGVRYRPRSLHLRER